MHELYDEPKVPVNGVLNPFQKDEKPLHGVVALKNSHGQQVSLFDGARRALYELVTNPIYKDVQVAVASTSLEPSYSHACLRGIEILPGQSMRDVIKFDQIGRSGRLTSRKTTHFRLLHEQSGIPYEEMLFFDGT